MMNATILIIEDEKSLANHYAQLLASMGLYPEICRTGKIAIARLAEELPPPVLILLDLLLPDIDGAQLLDAIVANPRFNDTKVIIITAYQDWASELQQKNSRAANVMIKPIDFNDLQEEVERLVV